MEYNQLKEKVQQLHLEYEKAVEDLKAEASKLRKSVNMEITNGGKTIILTNKNGLAISFPKETYLSSKFERPIYKFDGNKRTELIAKRDRRSTNELRLWLATINSL